jgi:zinc transporter ZupT
MPSSLKKLSTMIIWILFVTGCLTTLATVISPFLRYSNSSQLLELAVGVLALFLSFIAIDLKRRWDKT